MIRIIIACALFASLVPRAASQNDSSPGAWYTYNATLSGRHSPYSLGITGEARFFDLGSDLEQAFVSAIAMVALPDNASKLGLGYGFFLSESPADSEELFTEHRIHQEAALRHQVMRFDVSHRFRLEERFTEGRDFRTRYRYRVGLTVPLGENRIRKGSVYLVGTNEILLGGVGRNGGAVFDHDRLAGLLGYRLTSNVDIQAGYMAQIYANGTDGQVLVALRQKVTL